MMEQNILDTIDHMQFKQQGQTLLINQVMPTNLL